MQLQHKYIVFVHSSYKICDPVRKILHSLHNLKHYLQRLKSEYSKFQLNQASSFEVIALDSRASKKIDLYSNHTENNYKRLHLCLHLSTVLGFGLKCSPVIG